jgi:uncharacterized protein YkwD
MALALPAQPAVQPLDRAPRRVALLNRYEQQLLELVNAARSGHGRTRLAPSTGLTAAAELHAGRMVRRGFFDHEAPGEAPFWRRIERSYPSRGYDYWAVGENLAYGQPRLEPAEALREWLASPSHRRSVLSPAWREAGLAVVHAPAARGEFEGGPVTVVTLDLGVRRG